MQAVKARQDRARSTAGESNALRINAGPKIVAPQKSPSKDGAPLVRIKGVSKIFGAQDSRILHRIRSNFPFFSRRSGDRTAALDDVSLDIFRGEIFVVMGLSGSGKSTMVRCINGLVRPTAGKIFVGETDVCTASVVDMRTLRQRRMAMVFQSFALLPHMTVSENVEFGLMLRGDDPKQRAKRAAEVLEMVGLGSDRERQIAELSGGMKQRVGLARALATDPEILIMDEPFSALDPLIRKSLQDELLRLQNEMKKTIIFVTHDFTEAIRIGSRIAIMKSGRVVQTGTAAELFMQPADNYVEEFTSHVDCLQVLNVRDLINHPSGRPDPHPSSSGDGALTIGDTEPLSSLVHRLDVQGLVQVQSIEGKHLYRAEQLWDKVALISRSRRSNAHG